MTFAFSRDTIFAEVLSRAVLDPQATPGGFNSSPPARAVRRSFGETMTGVPKLSLFTFLEQSTFGTMLPFSSILFRVKVPQDPGAFDVPHLVEDDTEKISSF